MKIKIKYILAASITLGLFSCATPSETTTTSKSEYKMRTAEYKQLFINKNEIYQKPLVADLDVLKQKVFLSKTYENMTDESAKQNITGEFIVEQGCDILVQPLFQTETIITENKSTTNVSVSGYPAFYKNIRTYMPSDSEAFMIKSIVGSIKTANVDKPNTSVGITIVNKIEEIKKVVKNKSTFFILGLEASNPLGDFGKNQMLGYGLYGKLGFKVSDKINIHTEVAYLSYAGKTITYNDPYYYNNTYKNPSLNLLRYMAGMDIKLVKGLTASLQGGMCNLKQDYNKESDFTYNVGLGYQFSKVEVNLIYNSITAKYQNINAIGMRIGYRF